MVMALRYISLGEGGRQGVVYTSVRVGGGGVGGVLSEELFNQNFKESGTLLGSS